MGIVTALLKASRATALRHASELLRGAWGRGMPRALPVLAVVLVSGERPASADPTPSLAVDPAPAGDRAFLVERASPHGQLVPSLRLSSDYAAAPLVLKNKVEAIDRVVSRQLWVYALASISLAHRWVLHVTMPFVAAQEGDAPLVSGATAARVSSGAALGDARLGARWKVFGSSDEAPMKLDVALASAVWLPTASEGYTGDGAVRIRAALHVEGATKRLYWAATGGVRTRPFETLPAAIPSRVGTAIALGLAGGFYADARQRIALGVEVVSDLTVGGGTRIFDPRGTIGQSLLTTHFRPRGGPFELGAAVGPGFGQGLGRSDFRVWAMIGYSPDQAPPPSDEDADGVPDKADACIDLRGVPSSDPLMNGCPAVPIDRDGDGIPDENDACPTVAGESTRVKGTHGCPLPPDVDHDGVPDPVDACPNEPGPPPPAGNGCPKAPAAVTKLDQQEIVLSQQVQFETGTAVLRPASDGVLSEVARVLAEHPEVDLVEVQGHTDEVGSAEENRVLGQARAASVVAWLAAHGIARDRLVAKGYGSDRPIADNTTEEGRQKNRRVEFRVLRRKPPAPGARGGAP